MDFSARFQEDFWIMDIKYKVLDELIKLSKKNGYLKTETIVYIRKDLEEQHNKMLMLEIMESGNE